MKFNKASLVAFIAAAMSMALVDRTSALPVLNAADESEQALFARGGGDHDPVAPKMPQVSIGAMHIEGPISYNGVITHPEGIHRPGFTIGGHGPSSTFNAATSPPRSSRSPSPDYAAVLRHSDASHSHGSHSRSSSGDLHEMLRDLHLRGTSPGQSASASSSPPRSGEVSPRTANRRIRESFKRGDHLPTTSTSDSGYGQPEWFKNMEPGTRAPLQLDNGGKLAGNDHVTVEKTETGGKKYHGKIIIGAGNKGPISIGSVKIP